MALSDKRANDARHWALGLAILFTAVPGVALAHAAERGLILLLPTGYYLTGGALAVALSFLALAAGPAQSRLGRTRVLLRRVPSLEAATGWLSFFAFIALIWTGFNGSRDPLTNPLPLMVWTVIWVGLVAVSALVGGLWALIDPWRAPMQAVTRWFGPAPLRMPQRAWYWPACLGLIAFAWFEIADLAPDDPARLARAALIYWLVQASCMTAFGPARWRARGEAFSVFFRLIGRVAPLHLGRRLTLSWPGARLVRRRPWPLGGWVFVCLCPATVTFDGLAGTFFWLGAIGINPLEFPGRSATQGTSTLGLVGTWAAMALAYAATVTAGWRLTRQRPSLTTALGALAWSLLPIALAYHAAHYLTSLLVNGQYVLLAFSDPMGTGADLLGLGAFPVTTSFLNQLESVETIWQIQTTIIVGGHLLAVLIAHAIALRLWPDRRSAALAQIPLAALMVAYTVLGLWLLSAPTAF